MRVVVDLCVKIFTEKRPDDEELPTGTILAHIKSFASLQAGTF